MAKLIPLMTVTKPATDESTPELARRFCRGDRLAFAALYRRLFGKVTAAAKKLLRSREDAEDAAQWTFIRAWERREQLRSPGSICYWLIRIATNRARRICSGKARYQRDEQTLASLETPPKAHDVVELAETRQQLRSAMTTLSPRQHEVIALRIDEDLTFKEIGDRLGCSGVSARVNYHYGVRHLRERLVA